MSIKNKKKTSTVDWVVFPGDKENNQSIVDLIDKIDSLTKVEIKYRGFSYIGYSVRKPTFDFIVKSAIKVPDFQGIKFFKNDKDGVHLLSKNRLKDIATGQTSKKVNKAKLIEKLLTLKKRRSIKTNLFTTQ
jgi:hypothetical protein